MKTLKSVTLSIRASGIRRDQSAPVATRKAPSRRTPMKRNATNLCAFSFCELSTQLPSEFFIYVGRPPLDLYVPNLP